MASACALRQLASAKLTYFQIMRLDPLVKNGRDVGQAEDAAQCGRRSQGEKARHALIDFHARSCSRAVLRAPRRLCPLFSANEFRVRPTPLTCVTES
jgi:hypothetical protein